MQYINLQPNMIFINRNKTKVSFSDSHTLLLIRIQLYLNGRDFERLF